LLFGRSVGELREVRRRGLAEAKGRPEPVLPRAADELWRMIPLDGDFVLVSRTGATLPEERRRAIVSILNSHSSQAAGKTKAPQSKEKKS
jgi:hypothetical protein